MAALEREWNTEAMPRTRLEVEIAVRAGTDPGNLQPSVENIGSFWEKMAVLIDAGHVNRGLLHGPASGRIQAWWTWLGPAVQLWREDEPQA